MRNVTVTALSSSLVVSDKPATLYGLSGINSGVEQYIQIHDAVSLPADTSIPVIVFKVPAGENFSVGFDPKGRIFDNGVVLCNSTTLDTKTIGAANCWFDAQVI